MSQKARTMPGTGTQLSFALVLMIYDVAVVVEFLPPESWCDDFALTS